MSRQSERRGRAPPPREDRVAPAGSAPHPALVVSLPRGEDLLRALGRNDPRDPIGLLEHDAEQIGPQLLHERLGRLLRQVQVARELTIRARHDFAFVADTNLAAGEGETEAIGRDWLARAGKRWRPFLSVASFQALRSDAAEPIPEDLKKIAVAVECFHKASLIHDDIEDEDAERYGEQTLHEEHGLAVALNVGDLLIGEGYRLIGETTVSAEQKAAMLSVAAEGQRHLCRGQGAELVWQRNPEPLKSVQVLDIFRQKTAPAFEVALRLGSIYADLRKYDEASEVIGKYSENLGIAYQIRDDLSDLGEDGETNDLEGLRPTLLLAVAHEKAKAEQKEQLAQVWRRQLPEGVTFEQIEQWYTDLKAVKRAEDLQLTYKELAIRSLTDLENANLKGLLRRVIGKIFNDTEIKGWCSEVQQVSELEKVRQRQAGPSEVAQA